MSRTHTIRIDTAAVGLALLGALTLVLAGCASTGADGSAPQAQPAPVAQPAAQAPADVPGQPAATPGAQQGNVSAEAAQGASLPTVEGKTPDEWNAAEQQLAARALERRTAIQTGDWAKAYSYTAPSYRALVSEQQYTGRFLSGASRQANAQVIKIHCESKDKCKLRLEVGVIMAQFFHMGEIKQGVDEVWVYENGQWWKFENI